MSKLDLAKVDWIDLIAELRSRNMAVVVFCPDDTPEWPDYDGVGGCEEWFSTVRNDLEDRLT